jgi:flavin reductase (DIM6/NTAB) family NADH-FMN oxidoreductase RutF/DNA-binding GntR family transcriptional regulator
VLEESASLEGSYVDSGVFRHVVGHLTSGVCVVTTSVDGAPYGMTASSVTSLSMDPPMMLVCVNRAAPMAIKVSASGFFAINVLSDRGTQLATQFATPSADKFHGVTTSVGISGAPILEEALAHLECEVIEEVIGGSHLIFLGRVIRAQAAQDGEPLTYFRGKFGRFQFSLNDEVYRLIRNLVVHRNYEADSTLDPSDLAANLNVDESAVFYALTRLFDDGLVQRDSTRGYVVVPLDAALCDETFDARATIQAGVIQSSLHHVADEKFLVLQKYLEEMKCVVIDDQFTDFELYLEANYGFHSGIVKLSENSALESAFNDLGLKGVMARSFGATTKTSVEFIAVQERILNALMRREIPETIAELRRYSAMAKVRLREVLAESGGRL